MTIVGRIKNALRTRRALLAETWAYYRLQKRFNASVRTEKDPVKWRYLLLRETHTIEKGMSLRSPRKGFGQAKARHLIDGLMAYKAIYVQDGFMEYPLRTLKAYIDYTESNGIAIDDLKADFNKLAPEDLLATAPVIDLPKEECSGEGKDFKALMDARHSMRYFKPEPVGKELINNALLMASKTPSACNRQAWRTHVFTSTQAHELLRWQGGSRGFEEEIGTAILVTADLRAFLYYEQRQAYIDGGLYAMNLLNALHSEGLGTIPLSCGFLSFKLRSLKDFGIPENEVPIMIIGVGVMEDHVRVARSDRRPIEETNTYHQ